MSSCVPRPVLRSCWLGRAKYGNVVALWEAFYIENKRFDLDTLRVPNRSPTPISKSNDFLGQSGDIWGARGPHSRTILEVPGVRAGLKHTYCLALSNGHHGNEEKQLKKHWMKHLIAQSRRGTRKSLLKYVIC